MRDEKRLLTIDKYDYKLLMNILCDKRNEMIKANKSTDMIDELLIKIIDSPIKKIFKKDKSNEAR